MSWAEASPGVWKRELGGLEKIYRFSSQTFKPFGREQWLLHTICAINFNPDVDIIAALRDGWKQLLFEHPALATTVDGYTAVHVQNFDNPETLKDYMNQTFVLEPSRTAHEVITEYELKELPTLVFLQSTSELMLLASHWRIDATGCSLLLDRLFNLVVAQLSGPANNVTHGSSEDYFVQPPPSMEDAAAAPKSTSPEVENTADRVTRVFREAAQKTLGLTYKGDTSTAPGNSACESIVLTPESTKALIDTCKQHGSISVSAAVYASLGTALLQRNMSEASNPASEYTTIMAVNMRPHLPEPFNGPAYACAPYVSSITPKMQRGDGFLTSAAALTHELKTWHTDSYSTALREIYCRASGALLNRPRPQGPPPPPPHGITFSSLGIINKLITGTYPATNAPEASHAISVNRFRFGVSIYTRQMLMYLWTFGGQMHMSINYNRAYYDPDAPRDLLKSIHCILEEGLAVELPFKTEHDKK
ncbi:hypothetical protein F5883DRAFT_548452 [Diaporthe sp. PMI_573]|jgi:hypothetical protein|nr:hypothetical protein F5883DRAFT_548452 [Diaporthaceae sp. PMI_573]